MKINSKILLILFVFFGVNQLVCQEQKNSQNRKSETDVPVYSDIDHMTPFHFTIWKSTGEPPVIKNSLLMSESFGVINVGGIQSSIGSNEIFSINGKLSVMDRIEYKTNSAEIMWGNSKTIAEILWQQSDKLRGYLVSAEYKHLAHKSITESLAYKVPYRIYEKL